MNFLKKGFIIILFFSAGISVSTAISAQAEYKSGLEKVFYFIYNQQFSDAENALQSLSSEPDTLVIEILETELKWWETMATYDNREFKLLEEQLKIKLENIPPQFQNRKLIELLYLNYLLRLAALNNNYFKTIGYIFRINKLIDDIPMENSDVLQQNIYAIIIAVYNVGKSKFLIFNDNFRQENIAVLTRFTNAESLIPKTLSYYFLAKIYTEIEKSPQKAKYCFSELHKMFPGNTIFARELLKYQ